MSLLKEIKITEIGDFRIGNVEDKDVKIDYKSFYLN